jgi:hypothetical protein
MPRPRGSMTSRRPWSVSRKRRRCVHLEAQRNQVCLLEHSCRGGMVTGSGLLKLLGGRLQQVAPWLSGVGACGI